MVRLIAVALVLVGAALTCYAQTPKFAPKQGDTLRFVRDISSNVTQSISGVEMSMNMSFDGPVALAATKVRDTEIEWWALAPSTRFVVDAPMQGVTLDTVVTGSAVGLVTNRDGRIESVSGRLTDVGEVGSMVPQSAGEGEFELYFLPALPKNVKVGQSWKTSRSDTAEQGAMVTQLSLVYTYEGMVDTLGTKATRVRIQSDTLSMSGEYAQGGVTAAMDGSGQVNATLYYSSGDGMLLWAHHHTAATINVVVMGPQNMVIPVTQSTHVRIRRAATTDR